MRPLDLRRAAPLGLAAALLLAACSDGGEDPASGAPASRDTATTDTTAGDVVDLDGADALAADVHGSVGQVWLTGAPPSADLRLADADGVVVAEGTTDSEGSLILREVEPGAGYRVVAEDEAGAVAASAPVEVTAEDDAPDPSLYEQQAIGPGYGYLETRDGTSLAINVLLPGPPGDGPYPTVVEYSGYSPADPGSPQPSMLIAQGLGYAVVGVNMRGTGCSGGAFDFFEPLQSTDGYDALEAIARQDWVLGNRVGMVGLSYPGISQLFTARLQPPSLAAIAPLSVIADTARGTLYPGGILNDGFATRWAEERASGAEPGGQAWSQQRIDDGDETCVANQALRGQTPDILGLIDQNRYWSARAESIAPETFVERIDVPVFLAGAWQDEQTGGYFANMIDELADNPDVWVTATNGGHTDSVGPQILPRWAEFLELFVARRVPQVHDQALAAAATVGQAVFGSAVPVTAPDRFAGVTDYEAALEEYREDPRVRVLFENGAGAAPGVPVPGFEAGFDAWPVPGTEARAWYFSENGVLNDDAPEEEGSDSYRYDPSQSQTTTIPPGSDSLVWTTQPQWRWFAPAPGTGLSYESGPLDADLVMAGTGSIDLWLGSTADDTDVEVSLVEVRPDGQEVLVQSGWLRASFRALADDEDTSELRPLHSFAEEDAAPIPAGELVEARVEMFPFAHVFREGSRVRVIVDAPGASRQRWTFDALPADGDQVDTLGRGGAQASRVVLPVVEGVDVPTPLPACGALRGQPCRAYLEIPTA